MSNGEKKPKWKTDKKSLLTKADEEAFFVWLSHLANEQGSEQMGLIDAYNTWLLTTGDGDTVLKRLIDVPRQLFLPYPDDERPWVEIATDPAVNECVCALGGRTEAEVSWQDCPVHKESTNGEEPTSGEGTH